MLKNFPQAIIALTQAYETLFEYYYQGKFEVEIESDYFKSIWVLPIVGEVEEMGENNFLSDKISLTNASRITAHIAQSFEKNLLLNQDDLPPDELGKAIVLIWKVLILNYEIEDYHFSLSNKRINYFINLATEINDNLHGYFNSHYQSLKGSEYESLISKKLILVIIMGANSLYRKHTEISYEKGLELINGAARYIQNIYKTENDGLGTKGIHFYISGHVSRSLGDYEQAEKYFRQSAEAYSKRIVIKEKELKKQLTVLNGKFKKNEIDQNTCESEITKLQKRFNSRLLLTLRRCALATAFGTAYIAFSGGQVTKALDLLTLAQSVLKRNCGKIYETYVSFLYSVARRAVSTNDEIKLLEIIADYKHYLKIFEELIPDSPYQQRVKIESAICYYHLGRIFKRKNIHSKAVKHLKKSETLLKEVIKFSQQKTSPSDSLESSGDANKKRNPRLLSEALINLTYVYLMLEDFDKARQTANDALDEAKQIRPVLCEAFLALSRYYQTLAELPQFQNNAESIKLAWDNLRKSQKYIQPFDNKLLAHTILQMAELSLLKEDTWADANLYFQRWEAFKHLVEHQYCHTWSKEIEQKIKGKRLSQYFIISPNDSLNMKFQEERLKDYLRAQIILLTAIQIDSTSRPQLKKMSITYFLVQNIMTQTGLTDRGARDWIKKYGMVLKIKALCPFAKDMLE